MLNSEACRITKTTTSQIYYYIPNSNIQITNIPHNKTHQTAVCIR